MAKTCMKSGAVLALLFLVFAFSISAAEENQYATASSLVAVVDIKGAADVVKEDASGEMKRATVNLSLFPKNFGSQLVLSQETTPQAEMEDGSALFEYSYPEKDIEFRMVSKVRTSAYHAKIAGKIAFPLTGVPEDVVRYAKATEIIDSDDNGINLVASQLVEGEDDLYKTVFEIAKWTRENVDYNLSSLTADVSQKASWVLAERKGVCDEITSLFIAMLRSIGIPARFVTGYAYTNSPLFPESWGAHGWAEVYFPNYGWVPYDVTYGQFAYVDATHIKMHHAADPNEASTRYEWLGKDVELELHELETKVQVESFDDDAQPFVQISVEALREEVSFSSYNGIEARIRNVGDAYVSAELALSIPKEIKVLGRKTKDIVLLPRQEKSVFWIVHVEGDLDDNFLYTFPIEVSSVRNANGAGAFKAAPHAASYSLQDIGSIVDQRAEEEEKTYSSKVALECAASKQKLYVYEDSTITCSIKNTGNVVLGSLSLCLRKDCEVLSLGISQEKSVDFSVDTSTIGRRDERIVARNMQISKSAEIPVEVLDAPAIEIRQLAHPAEVRFEDEVALSFVLDKASYSAPREVLVTLELPNAERKWTMVEMRQNQSFSTTIRGKDLREGENSIKVSVDYKDGNRREYAGSKEATIVLADVTLTQKAEIFFRGVGSSLEKVNPETMSFLLLLSVTVFVAVVVIVFRKTLKRLQAAERKQQETAEELEPEDVAEDAEVVEQAEAEEQQDEVPEEDLEEEFKELRKVAKEGKKVKGRSSKSK
jgi:hypothetical protein